MGAIGRDVGLSGAIGGLQRYIGLCGVAGKYETMVAVWVCGTLWSLIVSLGGLWGSGKLWGTVEGVLGYMGKERAVVGI